MILNLVQLMPGTRRFLLSIMAALFVSPLLAQDTIRVTVNCSAHGQIAPQGSFTLPVMSDMDVTATPDVGYEIEDWYLNQGVMGWSVQKQHLAFGDSDVAVFVQFQRITNIIHAVAGSGGSVADSYGVLTAGGFDSIKVGWGDNLGFVATPDPGYVVETWWVDSVAAQAGGNSFTLRAVTSGQSVYVTFVEGDFNVQVERTATNSVIVSWSAALRDWKLQENLTAGPQGWQDVTLSYQEVSNRRQVVVWPLANRRFYRLYQP